MITSAQFFHHPETFRTQSGESLPGFTLAYESYGELNADASNVILLFHALSGTAHAAGHCTNDRQNQ